MRNRPFFSIIMPTYNSETTIKKTLSSLQEQTIYPSDVELLVIDGGSSDSTLDIARCAGATVLPNPDRVPEAAKRIGLNRASGLFIIEMDSDEVLTSPGQLEKRKNALINHPDVQVMITKELAPLGENGFYSAYSTRLGDPFSFFIYRADGDYAQAYRKNIIKKNEGEIIFHFSDGDLMPIADGGTTTIGLDFMKKEFGHRMSDPSFAATMAAEVIRKTGKMMCLEDDRVIHNNPMSHKVYLKKLRFRVINNIFESEKSGFTSREKTSSGKHNKKYLYIPYCLLIIPVLFDSIALCYKYKSARYLEHISLSFYVLFLICGYMALKILGIKKANTSYGK